MSGGFNLNRRFACCAIAEAGCLRRLLLVLLLLCVAVLQACQKETPKPELRVKTGQLFPVLTVSDLEGNPQQLRFDLGKVTVLNIWATWCGPCRHEMPSLQGLANQLDKQKFQVIGISVDADEHVLREFLIDKKLSFPNYQDSEMNMANAVLGIRAFPSTFIIDASGILVEVKESWKYWDRPDVLKQMRALLKQQDSL